MSELFFRFLSGEKGIYEVVEKDCPKEDPRRENKPDGSWLPKVGENFPGAISFWSRFGLKKYVESGLLDWHVSVVKEPVSVLITDRPENVLYEDEFQIICDPKVEIKERVTWVDFKRRFL
ncbi:MAG TPA: hypothetical protein VJG90_05165 [Candidatus Nanoarchaeia archaeon]|nr:hypothetical protein [Candidatus Nanoarchaeia archaeon]